VSASGPAGDHPAASRSADGLAVVFDIGGVLLDWDPRYLYRSLFEDEPAMERFLAEVCTPDWNTALDAGRPFAEAVAELSGKFPGQRELIVAYDTRWVEMVRGAIGGTVEVLHELRAAGVPLYALSNWSAEKFRLMRDRHEFLAWFDGLVISGEVRVVKPDPRIFEHLLSTFGLEPGRTVFIDDNAANIDAAEAMGFRTVRFSSPDQLRASLRALGLPA
jgi:2-haloacid dehalogenase